jgi:hydroxymethylglutaryl-CoA synthase
MSIPQSWRNIRTSYRLLASVCDCGSKSFPPKEVCKECGRNTHIALKSLVKSGRLYSYTHRIENGEHIFPSYVEIDGIIVPSRLTDVDPEEIKIGMELEPTFRRLGETADGVIEYGTIFRPKIAWKEFNTYIPKRNSTRAGIIGYGVHIPRYRITMEEVAKSMKEDPELLKQSTMFLEKAVLNWDQDSTAMAVDAARNALLYAGIKGEDIDAIYFGSESKPYAVKASAITVAEAIGATPRVKAYDIESACKAATSAIPDAVAIVENEKFKIRNAMIIGSDNSQAREGDDLDPTSGTAAAAFIIGKNDVIAQLEGYAPYATDIPDFWRRDGEPFPKHGGRFTGEPAYFKHIIGACELLFSELGITGKDIDHAVFHMPTGKFPFKAAKRLGIDEEKLKYGFNANYIGNSYSACGLVGLAGVLDHAGDNETILLAQYGSGAGADALLFITEQAILEKRERGIKVETLLNDRKYTDFHTYRKRKFSHFHREF